MQQQTKVKFVNFPLQYKKIKKEIDAAIQDVLNRGDLILRKDVEEFEKTLADYVGTKYAIGVNSGTDALALSVKVLVDPGDEVIVPAHTFFATIEAVTHRRAIPVLVDVGPDLLMDMDDVENHITEKTKAIIPVHLAGSVCNMDKLLKIAMKYNLTIIEDAAQALGAKRGDKMAGSFGLTGCFSFYPAKMLGAYGDAGAITTNDWRIANTLRALRNHGGKPENEFEGFNSRLDNLQAAILNVKFKHLQGAIERRAEIAKMYLDGLKGINGLKLPPDTPGRVWQDFIIQNKMDGLYEYLKKRGIETIIDKYKFPNWYSIPSYTQYIGSTALRLPIAPELTDQEIKLVINTIKEFYE